MTIDVTLRGGVKFHDGTVLDADDVPYAYNWIIDEKSNSHAKGAIERWLKSVEKLDDRKVRFHLNAPYPLVLRDMARRVRLRKDNAYLADGAVDQDAIAGSGVVGLGPYRVVRFEPGQEVVLQRFADYYEESPKRPLAIGNIVIRNLPDVGTQQAELMSGGIDWM